MRPLDGHQDGVNALVANLILNRVDVLRRVGQQRRRQIAASFTPGIPITNPAPPASVAKRLRR